MIDSSVKTSVQCFTVVKKTQIKHACQKKGLMKTGKGERRATNIIKGVENSHKSNN